MSRLVVIVLFDGVDLLDVTGPPEVFSLLERELGGESGYRVVLAAASLDPVTTSAGVRILPDVTFADVANVDTLIVPGAVEPDEQHGVKAVVSDDLVATVRDLADGARRVTSVCVGAHILAAAGLLDGKRATTHWSTARQLAAEHPAIEVDADPIYIRADNVWTGAGISACLDLTLALVADDFGDALALRVARQLVMYLKRPGGQSQFSVALDPPSTSRRVDDLRHFITRNIAAELSGPQLAEHAHLSERQLARVFRTELGMTPAAYVEKARVEVARQRLETTDDGLQKIATTCGFNTVDTLARAFRRRLDTTPAEYRARFRMS
ncbi:GlxA family transcriptional regulator [Nocardia camponoti]|uniref:AraC family transcriptional regulator n=1 Tax=Nocardia camponoti TaxID=1616106 RepID=A0A917QJ20_9NOCA|nr:DJ-1/PfpI family protein [Nocardia camponoti]GGK52780.1 AraC family transcriptional regulator [Nocardia camponoti]